MNSKPILVVAVGGNALLKRGEEMSCANQIKNIAKTTSALAKLNEKYRLVIVHGNGPQVGLLALQNLKSAEAPPYPLDVLGAETQGMIGYLMEQGLQRVLPNTHISTVLTQIEVDVNDPAFKNPSKFIGPVYEKSEALNNAEKFSWDIKPDGEHWRRVVASPMPQKIVQLDAINALLNAGHIVICCGGGGSPVIRKENEIVGVEAVIDKDLAASVLAKQLNAKDFLILTDGENVCLDWGTPDEQPLFDIRVAEMGKYTFPPGSMGPKVDACCDFVQETQGSGHIGSLHRAFEIMSNESGTHILF
ncbi:carbamate kinase [Psychromonas aquimarina]|uniref:carbamate kinase n=1 Tax=Psychromonas aquimarina TaxID=444919 RepID=UPI0003FDF259|nr:carbamate kinase [Psychromonas aquimarina]